MFDVGFSELLVIAVVALLVLGPERLPKAAHFVGLWVRRARTQWNSVKAEFERDLADDDLKRSLRETQDALRDAQASLRNAGTGLQQELQSAGDMMRGLPAAAATEAASADLAPVESTRQLPGEPHTATLVAQPESESESESGDEPEFAHIPMDEAEFAPIPMDEEESMHIPIDEEHSIHAPTDAPPPPADADDEVPQR